MEDFCKDRGIGILLYDYGNVEEHLSPDPNKLKQNVDFKEYYKVIIRYFVGEMDKNKKIEAIIKSGLIIWDYWRRRWYNEKKKYIAQLKNENLAEEIIAYECVHWPLAVIIRDKKARNEIERIKKEIKNKCLIAKKSPWEIIFRNKIKCSRKASAEYLRKIKELAKILKNYNFSLKNYYQKEGADSLWKFKKIKNIGGSTIARLLIELNRVLGWPIGKNLKEDEYLLQIKQIKNGLQLLGISLTDIRNWCKKFGSKFGLTFGKVIPLLDSYSFWIITRDMKSFLKEDLKDVIEEYEDHLSAF